MKLILSVRGGGQRQIVRLYCDKCVDTDHLLEQIAGRLGVPLNKIFATLRLSRTSVRLISGWSLDHYRIREGIMIFVQVKDDSQPRFENTQFRGPSLTQINKDYCFYFEQEEQIGLELQLNKFINLVEEGTPASVQQFLQASPSFLSGTSDRAKRQRNNFVLNELNSKGRSALHCAVAKQRCQIVAVLLQQNVDVNCRTTDDWTPLLLAVQSGNIDLCTQLLNHPEIQVNQVTFKGSALHLAAMKCSKQLVQLLLEHEANQIAQDEQGRTPDEVCHDRRCIELIMYWKDLNKTPERNEDPIRVSGILSVVKRVFHTTKKMFMVMDSESSRLSIYRDEASVPQSLKEQILLSSVKEVYLVEDRLWWMNKELFYIALVTSSCRYFCTDFVRIAVKWVNCIRNACDHVNFSKEGHASEFGRYQELFLDSVRNKIVVKESIARSRSRSPTKTVAKKGSRRQRSLLRYELLKQIGEGAFGNVFLARHKQSELLYAIKVLDKKQLLNEGQLRYAYSQIEILERVKHPFIIELIDNFETKDMLYMVLDYCPNGSLADYLYEAGVLKQSAVKLLIAQIILAIQYLHNNGILYRDLKPENILISKEGYLKVTDFGLSKLVDHHMEARTFCGSPIYTCPELLVGDTFTSASDIYGIGCVLHEMLLGDPPFYSDNIHKLYEKIKAGLTKIEGKISDSASSLLKGMIHRQPNQRLTLKDIKKHPFFEGFNWESVQNQQFQGINLASKENSEDEEDPNSADWNNDYEEDD